MMKGGIAGLMQQAQKMQERMQKAQEELALKEVEGQSGAGMVKVTMTGKHAVKRVQIDPQLLAEDRDMLEDLVAAAVNRDLVAHFVRQASLRFCVCLGWGGHAISFLE